MARRRLTHHEYTVGWICALEIELKAACAILDEVHKTLPSADHDDNVYTLGQAAQRNIVIACLPKGVYGTTQAANVAHGMNASFPNIQYRFMVGIGGGVPYPGDVRLGDVVIGVPGANSPGIVAYDHGKTTSGGHLKQTVILNKPPLNMLKAVPHLGLGHVLSVSQTLETVFASDPTALAQFTCPGEKNDKLFEAEYDHLDSNQSCSSCCDETKIVPRLQRKIDGPHIHTGTIGSGNSVIKDARTRDSLAKAKGVLCFEMEAAGLVDSWPCLVIRGICDYSDSHKQKQWQPYAAITAAACARSLMSLLDGKQQGYQQDHEQGGVPPGHAEVRKNCVQALSFSNPIRHREDLQDRKGRRVKGTCEWMLKTSIFQEWCEGSRKEKDSNILWLHGLPASGKSMMTIFLTEALEKDTNLADAGLVIYFFCDSSSQNHTSGIAVLSGLIWQLTKDRPKIQEEVRKMYEEDKGLFTSFNHLWKLFIMLLKEWSEGKIYCVIDAIDECDRESQNAILGKFENLFDQDYYDASVSHVYFLITSRPYEDIRTYLGGFVNADIGGFAEAQHDVAAFIEHQMDKWTQKKKFPDNTRERVFQIVQKKAEGTFLWVSLAMEELNNAAWPEIIGILDQLPTGLSSLYGKLLERAAQDRPGREQEILRIVNVVAVSLQPLSLLQLAYACQLYELESEKEKLFAMESSIRDCKLLLVEAKGKVSLLHKSVKDYLTDKRYSSDTGLSVAHAFLAYRCIDCCMESVGVPIVVSKIWRYKYVEFDDNSLLAYSTLLWPEHAHFAGEQFEIIERHEPFFKENSLLWQNWWSHLSALGTYKTWAQPSPFHIAARWGILPLVKYILQTTSKHKYDRTEYLDTDFVTQDGETALELAASSGHEEVVRHLLERASEEMVIFSGVLNAAIKNTQRGAQIINTLLQHPRVHLSNWSYSHLVEAAKNPVCGAEILQSLYKKIPKLWSSLDGDLLVAAAENTDFAPMDLLLKLAIDKTHLSKEILLKAAKNEAQGYKMTSRLLQFETKGLITESILRAAAKNTRHGRSILKDLLRQYNGRISAKTLIEAATVGEDRAHLLLPHSSGMHISYNDILGIRDCDPETATDVVRKIFVENRATYTLNSRTLQACCKHLTGAQVSLILEREDNRQHITSSVFAAAAENGWHCIAVMESLRKHYKEPIPFTQEVLDLLMRFNGSYEVINYVWEHTDRERANISIRRWSRIGLGSKGLKTVQALLDRDGGVMKIRRRDLYSHSLHTHKSWNQFLHWALEHPRHKLRISPRAIELILRHWSERTARALLQQNQSQISFHEQALKIIVEWFDQSDLITVLNGMQKPLTVTEGILIAASRNKRCHREMLRILIDRMGQTVSATPNIIRAIARADEGSLDLLMSRNGGCFKIIDDVVIERSENDLNDYKVPRTLLSQNKEKRSITPRVAIAIVGLYDATVVELLLQKYMIAGLSNNMIVAALSNSININPAAILEILLRESRKWKFDGTWWSSIAREISEDTFQWLRVKLFNNNATSESFLEGALSNPRLSFQSICHLLESIPAQETISQRLVACIARNQIHSRRLVEFTLARNDAQLVFITDELVGGGLGAQRLGDVAMKDLLSIDSNRINMTHNGVYNILRWYDLSIVDCLIRRTGTDFHFTADLIQALISNSTHGKDIMCWALIDNNIQLSPPQLAAVIESGCFNIDVLRQILTSPSMSMTEQLFDDGYSVMNAYPNTPCIGSVHIKTPAMARMIGTPDRNNLLLLKLLLRQPPTQVSITQPAIRAALRAFNTHELESFIEILRLLMKRGERIIADEECMAELFANKYAERLMETICEYKIEEELIISNAMVNRLMHSTAIETLAKHARFQVVITEAAMHNIASRSDYTTDMRWRDLDMPWLDLDMHWLISRPNWEVPITEVVLCAGLINRCKISHLMALFQHARHVKPTAVFFKTLTKSMVTTLEGKYSTKEIEGLLGFLQKVPLAGCIRADMVDDIVEHCSSPVVLALLDRVKDPIPVSSNTLPLIARRFGENITTMFLDRRRNDSLITEDVLAAAASNRAHARDIVTLLLQRLALVPTESVLLAAATNPVQGLNVLTILLDHLPKTSRKIVGTDPNNDGVVLESLFAKDILFAVLETSSANATQDQALRIVAMLIQRRVSVVFNEEDLLKLFELFLLAPHFHFILQTHRGRLPTITTNLIARVRLRARSQLNMFYYDPLFVPAIHLAINDIDPITLWCLLAQNFRPPEEIGTVVKSCRSQCVGKPVMLQALNSQEIEISGEMISNAAVNQLGAFKQLQQPNVKITRNALQKILQFLNPEYNIDLWELSELLKLKPMSEIIDEEMWIFMVSKFTNLDMSHLDLSLLDWKKVFEKAARRGMISETVLLSVIRTKNYNMLDLCLKNYPKPLVVTQQLVDAFASRFFAPTWLPSRSHTRPDVNSLRRLLEHESLVHPVHSSCFKSIFEIFGSRIADELFKITKNRPLVDESLLVSVISTKNVKILDSFFKEYQGDLTITPRIVISALQPNAPDHAEVAAEDEYDEPDWSESDQCSDSSSNSDRWMRDPRDDHWLAEMEGPNDEGDDECLKMNGDTNTEHYTSAYLLEYLLCYYAYDPSELTEDILLSVIKNIGECEALFTIIVKYYSLENVRITENISKAAASNSMRSVQLLLDLFPGKVPITEEVLIAAARNSKESYETLRLLLSCSSHRISVSKSVMIALLQNSNSCLSAFRLVIGYGGSDLFKSQEVKSLIVCNANRSSVLQYFLELPRFGLTVTKSMIRSDIEKGGIILNSLLFNIPKVRFTPASIAFIMAKGDTESTMSLLEKLATGRDDRHLTENVFLHAISNEDKAAFLTVHHLLSRTGNLPTEKAWIAAAKNKVNGWILMQMFADYDKPLESMTPKVLLHAARNDKLANHILKWLLSYHPTKVRFCEDILAAISGNPVWWMGEPLTSETYRPHIWQNGPILEVILHQAQEKAQITDNILIAAVKNPKHSARYVRVLLQHHTREALDLQKVTRIAVAQEFVEIKTLLALFEHGARINEDIVVAAMMNSKRGGDIFELLRVENLWRDFVATDKVVLAAAENEENGNELLEDFLRSYQGVIVLSDEHIKNVANSFSFDVIRQLRIRQRFPISNPLPVFVYFHYLFYVLHRWLVLYC
jgi:nucleoside phosphorylase